VQTWEFANPGSLTSYTVPISSTDEIAGVYMIPDGLRMATRTAQGSTDVWDIASGEIQFSLPARGEVNFSPDGRSLAIGNVDGSVSLWEAVSGELLSTIPAHDQPVVGLSFSPDGKYLATSSMDTTARIWDLSTGEQLFSLPHSSSAFSPIFSPDRNRLAVNQTDGSLYLWDIDAGSPTAGQVLSKFSGLDEFAVFNGFSPDGKIVYVGGYFGQKVRFYTQPLADLVMLARSRLTRRWTEEECQRYRIEPCR
jgi:WD40 repeat protein